MKSIIISTLVVFFIVATGFHALGEEWTQEQKDVWSVVEQYYSNIYNGDVAATMALVHDKSLELFSDKSIPLTKDLMEYTYKEWVSIKPTIKVKPISIAVIDHRVANAFYYFQWESQVGNWSGKGRGMQTFMKQSDKWISIGAIYSKCNKPPPCPSE